MSESMGKARERILGIDLGTTNSAAAIMEAGRPVIIPSAEGPTIAGKMFPSVVAFTKDDQLLVGEPAMRRPSQTLKEPFSKLRERWEPTIKLRSTAKNTILNRFRLSSCRK